MDTAHDTVSTLRLYLLRAMYLLIVVGLGVQVWPGIVNAPPNLEHLRTVVRALLGGITLMALIGLRYPLKMLPLLFFELAWKTLWVLVFGLPAWRAGTMDADMHETFVACLMGVVLVPLVLPWGYVWRQYVRAPGDRWTRRA
jgi:hypothetical protein